ncbi:MAG: aldose 1-epimerase [Saprospiraceae bacterium]
MFTIHSDDFGAFKRYTLSHETHPLRRTFVPERGGCMLSLQMEGQELLDGYQTPIELDLNNWGKSGFLYPFPNRLRDGRFTWNGTTYQFPLNDTTHQNALHGFGMQRPLELVEADMHAQHAVVRMEGQYTGDLPYYPWPFTFFLTYRLFAPGQCWVEMGVRNDGDTSIPIGLGWHPYFQLADTAAECELCLPPVDMVGIDARMIPTGKRYPFTDFAESKKIGATILDNCFALAGTHAEVSVLLKGTKGSIRYWQESGAGQFSFLQVFTPPYGTSIALEPMTCNVDAFNNKEGLWVLAPGQFAQAKAGVQWVAEV